MTATVPEDERPRVPCPICDADTGQFSLKIHLILCHPQEVERARSGNP